MAVCKPDIHTLDIRNTHTYVRTYIFLLWGAILYTVNTIICPIFLYIVMNCYAVYASEKKLNRVL